MNYQYIVDSDLIEKKSMQIISKMLGEMTSSAQELEIIKRTILATADFHYAKILQFHEKPIETAMSSIRRGRPIVTDTKMAFSGINARLLDKYGVEVKCYLEDNLGKEAFERKVTPSMIAMERAAAECKKGIYVVGSDATALYKLLELIEKKEVNPDVIIGVPVGFIGATEVKEELQKLAIPSIVTEGQKGGCNIAAAIINAIAYLTDIEED